MEVPLWLEITARDEEKRRPLPTGSSHHILYEIFKPTENTENKDTSVTLTQIEHTLKWASFSIVKEESITDRIATTFMFLP